MTSSASRGFTLLELIAVITVLAVLAAVAVPRFVDLSAAARQAAVDDLAADLSTASASNLATYIVNQAYPDQIGKSAVFMASCGAAGELLTTGLPSGFGVESTDPVDDSVAHLQNIRCDVFDGSDSSVRSGFTLYGINPVPSFP